MHAARRVAAARALLLATLGCVQPACAETCDFDTDCDAGETCVESSCATIAPSALEGARDGHCASDADCSTREVCYGARCVDATLTSSGTECPYAPLADELVCTNWDQQQCPCYAGEVSFREQTLDGALSCGGVTGIYSDHVWLKQVGCHVEALGGELSFDAIGFGELRLRLAQLPNDTSCSALADRAPEGPSGESRPAVRLTCGESCTMWMEAYLRPVPERLVPSGESELGTADAASVPGGADERPAHVVNLTCFYIDRFEVSRSEYAECLAEGACEPPQLALAGEDPARYFGVRNSSLPITWLNHRQAEQYCAFRGKALPTEAEWERAARGNRRAQTPWPWGADAPFTAAGAPDCETVNFFGCAGAPLPTTNGGGQARDDDDVGAQAMPDGASWFDVVDLGGNVREWTRDFYRADAYVARAATAGVRGARNPEQTEPFDGLRARVVRGGSYLSPVDPAASPPNDALRTSARDWLDEDASAPDLGLRCVRYHPGVRR